MIYLIEDCPGVKGAPAGQAFVAHDGSSRRRKLEENFSNQINRFSIQLCQFQKKKFRFINQLFCFFFSKKTLCVHNGALFRDFRSRQ
jgi:hypothetical protein